MSEGPASKKIDGTVPHLARVWDHLLGGTGHHPVDRQVGDDLKKIMPEVVDLVRAARHFTARAVSYLTYDLLMDRFIDIGAGVATANTTHEIVHSFNPTARVLYLDDDPLVLAHTRALLASTTLGLCQSQKADPRDPDRILHQAQGFLDWTRPIALILRTLDFIPERQAVSIVDRLIAELPPGSCLALHGTTNHVTGTRVDEAVRLWNESGTATPMTLRTPAQIAEFLRNTIYEAPGVVPMQLWRPEHPGVPGEPVDADAAVGHKRR
ncbi:SAM-dependent methyltransferase [Actinomadura sp. NPDC023710]|uniref:SAM-dependent methyltransferase n=1 Tax=Actinomadura sp. NPDC023710 TaxID=3158219 RepID=UPI0033E14C99